jgi:protein tyrosine/serine phosphatase
MKRAAIITAGVVLATLAGTAVYVGNTPQQASRPRDSQWAQPIDLAGVPNLHKVSEQLYRSAQPSAEGIENLKKVGVETIVNLRSFHSDRDEIADAPVDYEHITMKPWQPEYKEIVQFLKIVTDPNSTPVLVHCRHGADRTGTMCAIYRIVVQGWTKEQAIKEMTEGGFGFHQVWDNLVRYIEGLNVERIRMDSMF